MNYSFDTRHDDKPQIEIPEGSSDIYVQRVENGFDYRFWVTFIEGSELLGLICIYNPRNIWALGQVLESENWQRHPITDDRILFSLKVEHAAV